MISCTKKTNPLISSIGIRTMDVVSLAKLEFRCQMPPLLWLRQPRHHPLRPTYGRSRLRPLGAYPMLPFYERPHWGLMSPFLRHSRHPYETLPTYGRTSFRLIQKDDIGVQKNMIINGKEI
jgi:hypothetical protein